MTTNPRQRAERSGRNAELIASIFLMIKGYRLLERRYKAKSGEIDLITKQKHTIVIIEVKSRANLNDALEAVTPRNRRRIENAGRSYLARHPDFAVFGLRYDIIAIAGLRLQHIRDAWRDGE